MWIVSFVTLWWNWNLKNGHQSCFLDKLQNTWNTSDGSDSGSFCEHDINYFDKLKKFYEFSILSWK